jgi:hypothetical protein
MKELPQYTLLQFMGWWATRYVPLSESACVTLKSIINNDNDFLNFVPFSAGLNIDNSMGYIQGLWGISNIQKFNNLAQSIIVPPNLFTYIDLIYLPGKELLDDKMVEMLLTVVKMTPEFAPYLDKLAGITGENSGQYISVIFTLYNFPIFRINAQQFYLSDEK